MPKFSIVIPIYNEEESIAPLYFSIRDIMDTLDQAYEIIIVNDGSKDRSREILNSLKLKSPSNLVIINLSRHAGQSIALQTGFDIARGDLIITMDGDLQNDPQDISRLLDKMKEGYDVICGWRYNRKDPYSKLFVSKISYFVHKIIFREKIHDPGCTLRIFKKELLKKIFLFPGAHRFFTLIVIRLGFKIGEIKVEHRRRQFGESKYNIHNRLFEYTRDLIRFLLFDIHRLMARRNNYEIKEVIRN